MLVLSRRKNESIVIGDNVVVTLVDLRGDKVRIGVSAPIDVAVHREEIYDSINGPGATAALVHTRPPAGGRS